MTQIRSNYWKIGTSSFAISTVMKEITNTYIIVFISGVRFDNDVKIFSRLNHRWITDSIILVSAHSFSRLSSHLINPINILAIVACYFETLCRVLGTTLELRLLIKDFIIREWITMPSHFQKSFVLPLIAQPVPVNLWVTYFLPFYNFSSQ